MKKLDITLTPIATQTFVKLKKNRDKLNKKMSMSDYIEYLAVMHARVLAYEAQGETNDNNH